jgi:hypothetical protein
MAQTNLERLFDCAHRTVPLALSNWEERISIWDEDYYSRFPTAQLSETHLDFAVFEFDHSFDRVILAYALSIEQLTKRDVSRMRGFPNVNAGVRRVMGDKAFAADKGHFLGHASGGILDINLFPQRRELNRGWSAEGKRFRNMERYVADHSETFFYHRPQYDDESWIPRELEYGVLVDDVRWWVDTFQNK